MAQDRKANLTRKTAETDIALTLAVDGAGRSKIDTGVPFFDHMLTLFAKHGLFDLDVRCKGDVEVDYHHTVEDVGLVLGDAFKQALGDKLGIKRYGFFLLPMDESLARVVVDMGGRPHLVYQVEAPTPFVRDFNIVLVKEFCYLFDLINSSHLAEKLFQSFGNFMFVENTIYKMKSLFVNINCFINYSTPNIFMYKRCHPSITCST